MKEEYFSLKLTALKNIKVRASEIICARSVCVQLLNFAGNRSIAIWVKVFVIHKMILLSKLHENTDLYMYGRSNIAMVSEYVKA